MEIITKWSHFMPLLLHIQVYKATCNVVSVFKHLPSVWGRTLRREMTSCNINYIVCIIFYIYFMYSGFSNWNKVGRAHLGSNKHSHLGKIPEMSYPLLLEGDDYYIVSDVIIGIQTHDLREIPVWCSTNWTMEPNMKCV